mmetsp:Transcript_83217/g.199690  ORF Transcript_83217/g.199690 Transcript_83217/m.199690 type:complete len:219 (-) Transcript_83217:1431-2087(-)
MSQLLHIDVAVSIQVKCGERVSHQAVATLLIQGQCGCEELCVGDLSILIQIHGRHDPAGVLSDAQLGQAKLELFLIQLPRLVRIQGFEEAVVLLEILHAHGRCHAKGHGPVEVAHLLAQGVGHHQGGVELLHLEPLVREALPGRPPARGVLLHERTDQGLRDLRDLVEARLSIRHLAVKDKNVVGAPEWPCTHEHLIEHDAQGPGITLLCQLPVKPFG